MKRRKQKKPVKPKEKIILDKKIFCGKITNADAGVAHLVERHLAKVEVASSSLVARSRKTSCFCNRFFNYAGMAELADALDLGSSGIPVQVQVLLPAPNKHGNFDTMSIETTVLFIA